MKKKYLIVVIVLIFINHTIYSQESQQSKVEQLTQALNDSVAPNFLVELKNNKGLVKIDQFTKTLDLRPRYQIASDTLSEEGKAKLYHSGRYIGSVYWLYNFESVTNSKALFKATKRQQIFCKISFKEQDTISIKSMLNAYTSHHRTLDSALHTVRWLGNKYISLLLTPKWVDNNIEMEVRGITISGKFERTDKYLIKKDYAKALRVIFRREFQKLFESEEMTMLLAEKLKS